MPNIQNNQLYQPSNTQNSEIGVWKEGFSELPFAIHEEPDS